MLLSTVLPTQRRIQVPDTSSYCKAQRYQQLKRVPSIRRPLAPQTNMAEPAGPRLVEEHKEYYGEHDLEIHELEMNIVRGVGEFGAVRDQPMEGRNRQKLTEHHYGLHLTMNCNWYSCFCTHISLITLVYRISQDVRATAVRPSTSVHDSQPSGCGVIQHALSAHRHIWCIFSAAQDLVEHPPLR